MKHLEDDYQKNKEIYDHYFENIGFMTCEPDETVLDLIRRIQNLGRLNELRELLIQCEKAEQDIQKYLK